MNLGLHQLQGCCGVTEIDGISEFKFPEEAAKAVFNDGYTFEESQINELQIPEASHLIFTQATRRKTRTGYGFSLADYVEFHKLGTVAFSDSAKNPNSSNYIVTFVWTLGSTKNIERWAKRMGFEV